MTSLLAPIVLFTYNRLDHTEKTVNALKLNTQAPDSQLYIYSDGAKNTAAHAGVAAVRDYLSTITGFASVTIIERERNFGLAASIVDGVSHVLKTHDRVIVLEDDILTSPHFLTFMNDSLTLYHNTPEVMHVSGYLFPVETAPTPDTFFYNHTSCWGWGTWARAWKNYRGDAAVLLAEITNTGRLHEFNLDGQFRFSSTLKANIAGTTSTWAIKWDASVFLKRGLCLHPRVSLVKNIGHDGSGVHAQTNDRYHDPNFSTTSSVIVTPQPLCESRAVRAQVANFHSRLRPRLLDRIKHLLRL